MPTGYRAGPYTYLAAQDHSEERSPRKVSRTLYTASTMELRAAFRSQGASHDHGM